MGWSGTVWMQDTGVGVIRRTEFSSIALAVCALSFGVVFGCFCFGPLQEICGGYNVYFVGLSSTVVESYGL